MSYIKSLQSLRERISNTNPVEEAAKSLTPVNPRGFMPSISGASSRRGVAEVPQYEPISFVQSAMSEIHSAQSRFQEAMAKQQAKAAQAPAPSGVGALASGFLARRDQRRAEAPVVEEEDTEATGDAEESAVLSSGGSSSRASRDPSEAPAPVADYIRYSNSRATRNDPLSEELVASMSFLGEMGITADVISGGQENNTTSGTGSTRHNHGQSADVDFYIGDRKLDWNNPDDLPIFQEIVSRARESGITGIGAGDDYMGAGRMHLGFGNPGVWGANGSGSNAPSWLREAYYGA